MTKREEIDAVKAFVDSLPRFTYARMALEPFLMEFERGVYNDTVPTVLQSWDARRQAQTEAGEARAELAALRHEIDQARRQFERYCNSFESLRAKHRELSSMSHRMAEAIEGVANAADEYNAARV
jgi:hypothetical protein